MTEDRIYHALERIEDKLDKGLERISDLEIWRAGLKAKIGVIVTIGTIGLTLASNFIKEKIIKI